MCPLPPSALLTVSPCPSAWSVPALPHLPAPLPDSLKRISESKMILGESRMRNGGKKTSLTPVGMFLIL